MAISCHITRLCFRNLDYNVVIPPNSRSLSSSSSLGEPLVVLEDDAAELPAEEAVDEGVDDGVPVPDPEDGGVQQRGRVQLQQTRQGHPDRINDRYNNNI